jgi:hypothetical protein
VLGIGSKFIFKFLIRETKIPEKPLISKNIDFKVLPVAYDIENQYQSAMEYNTVQ